LVHYLPGQEQIKTPLSFSDSQSTKRILKYWGGMNGNGLGLKQGFKIKLVTGEIAVVRLVHVFMAVCTANATV